MTIHPEIETERKKLKDFIRPYIWKRFKNGEFKPLWKRARNIEEISYENLKMIISRMRRDKN